MANQDQVVYRLNALCRHDETVNAYVGYIPRLRLYTQARTKERLIRALNATATQFILACVTKKILGSVLRDSGAKCMADMTAEQIQERFRSENMEFVTVMGYEECEELVEIKVPMSLVVAQEAEVYA